jgi:hypothetical protein
MPLWIFSSEGDQVVQEYGEYVGNDLNTYKVFDELCELDRIDLEPDIYSFNFAGFTGKFVMNKSGQFIPFENHGLNIELQPGPAWKITTQDGTNYFFGISDNSRQRTYTKSFSFSRDNNPQDQYSCDGDCSPHACQQEHISSWYLEKIESANGHTIDFTYDKASKGIKAIPNFAEFQAAHEKHCQSNCLYDVDWVAGTGQTTPFQRAYLTRTEYDYLELHKIETTYERMEFISSSSNREDLIGGKKLDEIKLYRNNVLFQSFDFRIPTSSPTCKQLKTCGPIFFKPIRGIPEYLGIVSITIM